MLSYSKLGRYGNLGNQLFQIASTIGIAKRNSVPFIFPKWGYSKYFQSPIPQVDSISHYEKLNEPHYHYAKITPDPSRNFDLLGWFQTEKYWEQYESDVLNYLKFDDCFSEKCYQLHKEIFDCSSPVCAISVRRGDYVGNPHYHQLDMAYYAGAASKLNELYPSLNFLVFSDDLEWCRRKFTKPIKFGNRTAEFPGDRIFFTRAQSAIEQLACMSLCDHFIIANSTFSWWGAYLGEKRVDPTGPRKRSLNSKVIAPCRWNAGPLLKIADDKDVIPERWTQYDPNGDQNWGKCLRNCLPIDVLLPSSLLAQIKKIEGWLDDHEADLLMAVTFNIYKNMQPPYNIVEIGSYHGKSTVLLGTIARSLMPNAKIFAFDMNDEELGAVDLSLKTSSSSRDILRENIESASLTTIVETIQSPVDDTEWDMPVSLLFIDGLHDYLSVTRDFWKFAEWIRTGGYVAFHDYAHYYPGVVTFVNELLESGDYRKIQLVESLIILQKR